MIKLSFKDDDGSGDITKEKIKPTIEGDIKEENENDDDVEVVEEELPDYEDVETGLKVSFMQ